MIMFSSSSIVNGKANDRIPVSFKYKKKEKKAKKEGGKWKGKWNDNN